MFVHCATLKEFRELTKDLPDETIVYLDTTSAFEDVEVEVVDTPEDETPFVAVRVRDTM